jgi:hypothetical protein
MIAQGKARGVRKDGTVGARSKKWRSAASGGLERASVGLCPEFLGNDEAGMDPSCYLRLPTPPLSTNIHDKRHGSNRPAVTRIIHQIPADHLALDFPWIRRLMNLSSSRVAPTSASDTTIQGCSYAFHSLRRRQAGGQAHCAKAS